MGIIIGLIVAIIAFYILYYVLTFLGSMLQLGCGCLIFVIMAIIYFMSM